MMTHVPKLCLEAWREVVEAETRFIAARMDLFAECRPMLVELVKRGLRTDRVTAVGIAGLLTVSERQQLFADLLLLASFSHGLIEEVRRLIRLMPRDWVLEKIEAASEAILQKGTDEEYRRMIELFSELDTALARKLAVRACSHSDEVIREVGEDYFQRNE